MHSKFSRLSQFLTKLNCEQSLSVSSEPVERSRKHRNRVAKQKLAANYVHVKAQILKRPTRDRPRCCMLASHEKCISGPQNQSNGQRNTKIEQRSRNCMPLYIIREYNSKT